MSERKEPYYKPVAIKYGRRNEVRAHEGKEKRWQGDITSQAKKKKKRTFLETKASLRHFKAPSSECAPVRPH